MPDSKLRHQHVVFRVGPSNKALYNILSQLCFLEQRNNKALQSMCDSIRRVVQEQKGMSSLHLRFSELKNELEDWVRESFHLKYMITSENVGFLAGAKLEKKAISLELKGSKVKFYVFSVHGKEGLFIAFFYEGFSYLCFQNNARLGSQWENRWREDSGIEFANWIEGLSDAF